MPYRFALSEDFDESIRRIGAEQLDKAIASLSKAGATTRAVHDTRRAMKRVRALLRLARPCLDEDTYRAENNRFRDVARALAASRDGTVLIDTVEACAAEASGRTKSAFSAARARLARNEPANTSADHLAAQVIQDLAAGRRLWSQLPLRSEGSKTWEGLLVTYRRARRGFERAYERSDSESFHEWRKDVQYHARHMALLAQAWPRELEARVATAKELAAALGQDHDIAVLVTTLEAQASRLATTSTTEQTLSLSPSQTALAATFARSRQTKLRATCHTLGQQLFCESPRTFCDRVELYWSLAKADADREP